ncbi:MAG: hypothetical protein IJH50_04905 [Kiritimatiellae bacterium]|nr:hypothetical protein [Kiritimatiellia bacterium]
MVKKSNKLAALNVTQIFGNVEIAEGGFFECHGSMSGNVTNNGGGYEIHGSFTGEVYGDSDDDEEDYDIDEDN